MNIRAEKKEDIPHIFAVNAAAFSSDSEARLVDTLREKKAPMISLIAEEEGRIIGHILFTPVALLDKEHPPLAGLGPMAVHPDYQRKGVGGHLVDAGLKRCRKEGYRAVVVLGHADYYPRFGFVPSVAYGIDSNYDVQPEIFMIKVLVREGLKNVQGTICYNDLFNEV
jgi:putative acetyltransferase